MAKNPKGMTDVSHSSLTGDEKAGGQEYDPTQDLWRQFGEAVDIHTFCQSWLSLQCHMLGGVRTAVVLLGVPDRGPFTPAAVWPHPDSDVNHLTGAAELSLKERRGFFLRAKPSSPSGEEQAEPLGLTKNGAVHVSYPIEVSGKIYGVIVLETRLYPDQQTQHLMRQLHWGTAWLEVMLRRADALEAAQNNQRVQSVLNLTAAAVEHERFKAAAMAFVTRLSMLLECERVSLGFYQRKKLRIMAISHSAEFGKQMNLVRAVESAMDEAIDQNAIIVYPQPQDAAPMVTRAHADLARRHGALEICTIPLRYEGKIIGGLTLERPGARSFDATSVELCETAATLAGPILEAKRNEEQWLITKAGRSFTAHVEKLIGPGNVLFKLIAGSIVALILFFSFAKGDYRITAPTTLEGTVQRAVSAPFDGYITEARARAGDVVKQGDLMCLLDDRDFRLERLKWLSQKEQLSKEYREALAKHDRPQVRIVQAKIDQADAELSLIDEQLSRTKVVAPFDGVVMKGDLSQSLGAPVERGEVLFEVAPLESYRVIVEVDERDIADVAVGQRGELALPSLPGEVTPLSVEKITPVSVAKEGRNYFRVEAHLDKSSNRLRPGMEGIGKITVDRRRLFWIWTHELIDWLRLKLWSWWP
jgi:RND family efflux transporter MFP subunit